VILGGVCPIGWMVALSLSREDREIAEWLADGVSAPQIAEWLETPLRTAQRRIAAVKKSISEQTGRSLEPVKNDAVRRVGNLSPEFVRCN